MAMTEPRPARRCELTEEEVNWTCIGAAEYDSAVYANRLLADVFSHEVKLARQMSSVSTTLVEVGCGTCMFAHALVDDVRRVVGVDISRAFLDAAAQRCGERTNVDLIEGDACELSALLAPLELTHPVVVASVMNTLGIMPSGIRRQVVREMARVAGEDGIVFIVVFNADNFEEGLRSFYHENPSLCGPFTVKDVSYATQELRVKATGYYSHWFSVQELGELADSAGVAVTSISLAGAGLFLVGRGCSE